MNGFCSFREQPAFPDLSPAFSSCLGAEQIGLEEPVKGCVVVASATPRQDHHEHLTAENVSPDQMLGTEGAWYEALVFIVVTPSVWGTQTPKGTCEKS